MLPVAAVHLAGKHLAESKDDKFYVAISEWGEPQQILFSREDAQLTIAYEDFMVFSKQGMYEGILQRECGQLV